MYGGDGMCPQRQRKSCTTATGAPRRYVRGGTCHGDTPVICDDGNTCTDDFVRLAVGCVYGLNGSCDADPKGRGYYRKLCRRLAGPERITQADVDCVRDSCTFAGLSSTEQICEVLARGGGNECGTAEGHFLAFLLDSCRGRVNDSLTVRYRCTDNTFVGELRE